MILKAFTDHTELRYKGMVLSNIKNMNLRTRIRNDKLYSIMNGKKPCLNSALLFLYFSLCIIKILIGIYFIIKFTNLIQEENTLK